MDIHLLRHGIATDREDPTCPPDPERRLTERGRARTKQAAAGLALLGVVVDEVWTSPYLRAAETAALAAGALGVRHVVETDILLPDTPPEQAAHALAASGLASVLCVGHAPHLDRLIAHLVAAPTPFTALKKAGAARLELENTKKSAATLVWLLEPKALRRLADRS